MAAMTKRGDRERESVRTPTGEMISLPIVTRRSRVAIVLLIGLAVAVLLILLIVNQPATVITPLNGQPGSAQPTPIATQWVP